MTNLELAKQELAKVGGFLNKESSNPKVKKLLLTLKNVNTELTKIINGEDDFSFDDLEESRSSHSRISEAQTAAANRKKIDNSYGVDLGGFDNFINAKGSDAFDWRKTMQEANGFAQTDVNIDMDAISRSDFDEKVYGRIVDNT